MSSDRYNLRGVSSKKEDVHAAIKKIDKGLYPKAFCKIITSIRNFLPPQLEEEMGTPKFANDFFMACGMVQ